MIGRSRGLSPRTLELLRRRGWQTAVAVVMLAGLAFTATAGLIGTPIGSRNFAIAFVWIGWFAALIVLLIPLLGRAWCSVCPIPTLGDWAQRGAVLGPQVHSRRKPLLRVPSALRNMWIQNAAFALLALFSAAILTSPLLTGWALLAMVALALGLALVFERRAFCRYVCPMGGFIGLYSQVAPIELRAASREKCVACKTKACYNGSSAGYGCPWGIHPAGLTRNNYCGLCLECLRTCPNDNITVRTRPMGADLHTPSTRSDEAYKSLIMLGAAMAYTGVLLGPWNGLKLAVFGIGSLAWLGFAAAFLVLCLVILPGGLWIAAKTSQAIASRGAAVSSGGPHKARSTFAALSTSLIPLGLAFWAAFSLSFLFTNGTYVLNSISDPLGIGWNLVGTAHVAWRPMLAAAAAPLQTLIILGGFIWAARIAQSVTAKRGLPSLPMIAYMFVPTLGMLWLLL